MKKKPHPWTKQNFVKQLSEKQGIWERKVFVVYPPQSRGQMFPLAQHGVVEIQQNGNLPFQDEFRCNKSGGSRAFLNMFSPFFFPGSWFVFFFFFCVWTPADCILCTLLWRFFQGKFFFSSKNYIGDRKKGKKQNFNP